MRSYGVGLTILEVMWVDCSRLGMVCRVVAALEDVAVAFHFHMKPLQASPRLLCVT